MSIYDLTKALLTTKQHCNLCVKNQNKYTIKVKA